MSTVNLVTRVLSGILFTAMVLVAILMGSPIASFINPPSIIIVVGLPKGTERVDCNLVIITKIVP